MLHENAADDIIGDALSWKIPIDSRSLGRLISIAIPLQINGGKWLVSFT